MTTIVNDIDELNNSLHDLNNTISNFSKLVKTMDKINDFMIDGIMREYNKNFLNEEKIEVKNE